jgi:hypothetical protein
MFTTQFKLFVAVLVGLIVIIAGLAYADHLSRRVANLEGAVVNLDARLQPVSVATPTASPSATATPVPVKRFVPVTAVPTK